MKISNSFVVNENILACAIPFLKEIHIYDLNGKLCSKIENEYEKFSLYLVDLI